MEATLQNLEDEFKEEESPGSPVGNETLSIDMTKEKKYNDDQKVKETSAIDNKSKTMQVESTRTRSNELKCRLDQRERYILQMLLVGSLKIALNPLFLLPFLSLSLLGIYSVYFNFDLFHKISSFITTFYLIGIFLFFYFLSGHLTWLIDVLIRPRQVNYKEKYGSWVIVTGCTSGSGKEYVDFFAGQGMYILMISRSEEKLRKQKTLLLKKYNDIEVKYIVYDLTEEANMNGKEKNLFYEKLQNEIDEILHHRDESIGILVNNAGFNVDQPDFLEHVTDTDIANIINCNVVATVTLTKFIVPILKTKGKGAIIFVSSGSTSHPTPLLAVYSGSKAFINQFAISLAYELAPFDIDILLTLPYYMISNMYKKSKPSFLVCTAKRYVNDSLSSLGRYYISSGYYVHGFLNYILKYSEPNEDKRVTGNHILKLMLYNKKRIEKRIRNQRSNAVN